LKEQKNPVKAIRDFCKKCKLVCEECVLFPFKTGKNTFRKPKVLTEEQRKAAAARMEKMRGLIKKK
jgi:hypothetical protein